MVGIAKKSKHWFQFISIAVFILFMLIMIFAAYVAFTRQSGVTGLNVAKIQKLRYDSALNKSKTD